MQWLTSAIVIPFMLIACWMYTAGVAQTRFPTLRNKRIVLLIAHPDDEAMFFAPTLLALTNPKLGNHVKILCLSSGDADGLGETRKKELAKSGMILGLRKEDDVFVVEDPEFPDSMTTTWSDAKISTLLSRAFTQPASGAAKATSSTNSNPTPGVSIDVLLTFDANGVSSHPNHISLYHGARTFQAALIAKFGPGVLDVYTLTSVGIVRKYVAAFDAMTSMAVAAIRGFKEKSRGRADHPPALLFVSAPQQVRTAQAAMTAAHVSQMRWFRWGWIGLSRYMYVNDLKLERAG